MRPSCIFASDRVFVQALFASYGLATTANVVMYETSLARNVVVSTGWFGWSLLWLLCVCSVLSWADVILNHECLHGPRVQWLQRLRHLWSAGMCMSWTAMIVIGLPRFDTHGLLAVYTITVVFLLAWLVRDAARRRAAHASARQSD